MARTDAQLRFNPAFVSVCVREREKACDCDHAFISHAVSYSV